ncbi:MAG: hypothetical protein IIA07_12935 [Proteobacteria bacterium]|nr:hypothetical protein [Pseudomonadota bacterium]
MNFNAYSHDEIVDASERLYEALSVADLLRGLRVGGDHIDNMHLNDLGGLLVRLMNPPLAILNELRSETRDHDPDSGRQQPVLVSMRKKQDEGGAS